MSKRYTNPPIIEAVCEFRLPPDTKWDLTVPGLIYEELSGEFPNKEQRLFQEVKIVRGSQGLEQQIHTGERILFLNSDRKIFVQVGPHLLAVNCLAPYPTWTGFKPQIERAFQALASTIEIVRFQRIGLRYINRIEILEPSVNLDIYFEFRLFLGRNLPQNMTDFIVGCELPFSNGQDACRVKLTSAVSEKAESSAFILDLDYYLALPPVVSAPQALEWVENAHQQVERIFEGCVTDRLREIFQEVK